MERLDNKVALVTGATRGIGKAIALHLAQAGAFVVGIGTNPELLEQLKNDFKELNLNGTAYALDITKRNEIEDTLDQIATQHQSPAILVNNAGITRDNLLLRMDDEEWQQVLETNLTAVFHLSKTCVKFMFRARWGRIINIGSVVASSGNSGQVNYCASKAGLIGFSKALAQEVGSRNITVNVIAPGFIDTQMTEKLPDMIKTEMLKRIPLRRFGKDTDIAKITAFLASDSAAYITGQTIHVNGGMYMA